uniref:ASCIZ zinc finger protein, isoform A n=1 Tax=Drosophila melanogaster TaxID=7227 RepID=Q9VZU1_DROME|eukprot:NP_001261357.1 ASCIZ zinc finger protein, isoform B [Drosophila melanogaster]
MHSEKHTPDIRELMPVREHRCERCPSLVFGNLSHYQLHLRRRHQEVIPPSVIGPIVAFHCPVEKCIYHVATKGARSFTSLRLLRQHYQKSHLDKNYKCLACGGKFLLQHHLEKHQCSKHKCPVCELTYNSKAGLRTHMRRKNHLVHHESDKVPIPSLATWKRLNPQPIPVSADSLTAHSLKTGSDLHPSEEYINNLPSNLAGVTELYAEIPNPEANMPSTLELDTNLPAAEEHILCFLPIMDVSYALEMSSQKLDMETQTEEDDLNEIRNEVLAPLLRDIETQTPDTRGDIGTMTDDFPEEQEPVAVGSHFHAYSETEPMFDLQTSAHMYTQTCDDLFEELGLSHIQTQTHWPDGLYNTQHTQTCDEIMDELFPDNFQSTCTQTRWLD